MGAFTLKNQPAKDAPIKNDIKKDAEKNNDISEEEGKIFNSCIDYFINEQAVLEYCRTLFKTTL